MLSYLLAGFEPSGEPVVISSEVAIDNMGHILPIREMVRQGRSGTIGAVVMGRNEEFNKHTKKNPDWSRLAASSPSEFAERMIRLEISESEKNGRRDVGEPIAIVTLTATQGFIVEKIGACQENS